MSFRRNCPDIASEIQRLTIQQCEDKAKLKPSRSVCFSIASCYEIMRNRAANVPWRNLAWEKSVFPRHGFCMWLAIKERLKTKAALVHKGMSLEAQCVFCSQAEEKCEHLFFECPFTFSIWQDILRNMGIRRRPCSWSSERRWLLRKCKGRSKTARNVNTACAAAIYEVWRERNRRFFANEQRRQIDIIAYVRKWLERLAETHLL